LPQRTRARRRLRHAVRVQATQTSARPGRSGCAKNPVRDELGFVLF
jgi:hypothetical protein